MGCISEKSLPMKSEKLDMVDEWSVLLAALKVLVVSDTRPDAINDTKNNNKNNKCNNYNKNFGQLRTNKYTAKKHKYIFKALLYI